uniref:Uncharacterized protein n=1 Tax=Tetranychus urticae TaxID=32264 RepID=T1K6B2_TETUR
MSELSQVSKSDISDSLFPYPGLKDSKFDCGPIIEPFKGSFDDEKFETWIHEWEMAAIKNDWPASGWIFSVGIHLEGAALKAYASIVSRNDDWENFRESMIARFDSISPVVAFLRLRYCKSTGIDKYFKDCKWFAQHAGFTERQAVQIMIENLDFEFKRQLGHLNIETFPVFHEKLKSLENNLKNKSNQV